MPCAQPTRTPHALHAYEYCAADVVQPPSWSCPLAGWRSDDDGQVPLAIGGEANLGSYGQGGDECDVEGPAVRVYKAGGQGEPGGKLARIPTQELEACVRSNAVAQELEACARSSAVAREREAQKKRCVLPKHWVFGGFRRAGQEACTGTCVLPKSALESSGSNAVTR